MLGQNKNCVNFSFLVHVGIGPLNGKASEGFHPASVVSVPPLERLFRRGADAGHVAREMDDVLRTSDEREAAMDDDMIETLACHIGFDAVGEHSPAA
jgi:hypothetical protein